MCCKSSSLNQQPFVILQEGRKPESRCQQDLPSLKALEGYLVLPETLDVPSRGGGWWGEAGRGGGRLGGVPTPPQQLPGPRGSTRSGPGRMGSGFPQSTQTPKLLGNEPAPPSVPRAPPFSRGVCKGLQPPNAQPSFPSPRKGESKCLYGFRREKKKEKRRGGRENKQFLPWS